MKQYRKLIGTVGLAAAVVLMAGCVTRTTPSRRMAATADIVPVTVPSPAKVVSVDKDYRFVVIDFKNQPVPALGTELTVYRGKNLVGRVRLTDPTRGALATADILEGDVWIADEVR